MYIQQIFEIIQIIVTKNLQLLLNRQTNINTFNKCNIFMHMSHNGSWTIDDCSWTSDAACEPLMMLMGHWYMKEANLYLNLCKSNLILSDRFYCKNNNILKVFIWIIPKLPIPWWNMKWLTLPTISLILCNAMLNLKNVLCAKIKCYRLIISQYITTANISLL